MRRVYRAEVHYDAMTAGVGIISIGTFLPEAVRHNDWWPADRVARWMTARAAAPPLPPPTTPNMARVMEQMALQAIDPYQGVTERRVLDDALQSVDMEVAAAERALAESGIDRAQIDCLLTHTAVPDYLLSNTASVLHHRLGLAPRCFSMQAEAAGFSFVMQLALAEQFIALGRARYVMCVQSCAASRLIDVEDPFSPLLGDGAAAVIVGLVDRAAIVASSFRTDGSRPRVLVATVPGARWYDPGSVSLHRADPQQAISTFLETADRAKEVIDDVLAQAGVPATDVAFFGGHQGTPWLRQVIQEATGLANAKTVDVFSTTGYMVAVSIPLVLATALKSRSIAAGDPVLLFGGGVGASYGAMLLRWGDVGT